MKRSIVVILGVFLLAAGCGGPRWEDVKLEQQQHYIVRIQSQVENGQVVKQQYMHPVEIDSQKIAAFWRCRNCHRCCHGGQARD
jgi:uncharacterized protein YxeA